MESTGFRCNTYSQSNLRTHNTDFGEVKEHLKELFHVWLIKVATGFFLEMVPNLLWTEQH